VLLGLFVQLLVPSLRLMPSAATMKLIGKLSSLNAGKLAVLGMIFLLLTVLIQAFYYLSRELATIK
jgi:hypothetical protein